VEERAADQLVQIIQYSGRQGPVPQQALSQAYYQRALAFLCQFGDFVNTEFLCREQDAKQASHWGFTFWQQGCYATATACLERAIQLSGTAYAFFNLAMCLDDHACSLAKTESSKSAKLRQRAVEVLCECFRMEGSAKRRQDAEDTLKENGKSGLLSKAKRRLSRKAE
jgi:tetratricopeptide (TPR) repeat protein